MQAEPLVSREERPLPGRLEHEAALLPVTLQCASRTSLTVSFPQGAAPADRTEFPRLVVELQHGEVELSRCRLLLEEEGGGRLVFLDDVYDCRSLVAERRVVNVRSSFQKVPLVLAQKERIRPEFRQYTADLLYDLSAYKKLFGEQDQLLASEPPRMAREAEQALLATEGRDFFRFFDTRLAELGELVRGFTKEEHEQHGFYLRRLAWDFILCSDFLKRTNLKPRGYAGDAEMMVMAYENAFVGASLFGKLLHKHPLETAAAQAVRDRRQLVASALRSVRSRFGTPPAGGLRFMSLAAGPAWELRDIFQSEEDFSQLRCVLLDQDAHALACARETVRHVEAERRGRIDVEYQNDSVRTMLGRASTAKWGRFHFIYSMGLFDYLTPPVARAVLRRMYELLAPGGSLLVGNYHVANPTRLYMAYWMDWVLYHRTEQEFLELAEGLPGVEASVGFDPSGAQMFLRLDKQD